MKPRVLIVDNDAERGDVLLNMLAQGYECSKVQSLDEAFAAIGRFAWDVAVSNYDLGPRQSGIELLQAMREFSPHTVRVLYCRQYCEGLAHDAVRLAAAHAVVNARLPDFPGTLHETLERLLVAPSAGVPPGATAGGGADEADWFADSAASRTFVSALVVAAESERPVFLHGERGTGKNLAAGLFRKWRSRWRKHADRGVRAAGVRVRHSRWHAAAGHPVRQTTARWSGSARRPRPPA